MREEAAIAIADAIVLAATGKHLSDLQSAVLKGVWQGQRYLEIADTYGYTEGHVKDVGAQLWKLLTQALGEPITKGNLRSVLERQLQSGPQEPGGVVPPVGGQKVASFVGRAEAMTHLQSLVRQGASVIVIQGEGGIGKTTLAQHYLSQQGVEVILELLMAKETQNITPVEHVVEEWLRQDLNVEPGRELGVSLGRLRRQLQACRIGILIDNLEPALDRNGQFIPSHRRYVELLRVLSDVRGKSVTLMTSRDRLCEPDIRLDHYRLSGLDEQAWQVFFSDRHTQIQPSVLRSLHQTYGGNAKAMDILCGVIREDFGGDANAYWQVNGHDPLVEIDLKNLVSSQFNRLLSLDLSAYRLLCRLGCYRYQEIATVPTAGVVSLLWDIEASGQRRTLTALRNRSLVECAKGHYWLHPVIRAEAIARLRVSDDWETANRRAAEFWTGSVTTITTLQEARTALEAYYHFLTIQDFESAGRVILQSRDNRWQQFLPLGSTLYRLGLIQPVLSAIAQVIEQVQSDASRSELYNIWGDLHWITGQIHRAIACQEQTMSIATQCLQSLAPTPENRHTRYYLKMLQVDSLLSLGLYKVDLWELPEAARLFQAVITLARETDHHRWAVKALVCLALVDTYRGHQAEAAQAADRIHHTVMTDRSGEYTGRFAYFLQILGQTYANLGATDRALQLYQQAIAFAEASHYKQVKAKVMGGLAAIDRTRGDFDAALRRHREAIALLEEIGAQCDLAEAYYQVGLTLQQVNQRVQSQEALHQALVLFRRTEAPRQVKRVLSALRILQASG